MSISVQAGGADRALPRVDLVPARIGRVGSAKAAAKSGGLARIGVNRLQ
ncbi:hypothetical protein [Burkholderia ubonensis]|nr:hypothetical protein [Burkholderia ubonensis]